MNSTPDTSTTSSSLASQVLGLVDEHWIDFAVSHVSPLFSLSRTKARVVSITAETDDAVRVELAPNRHWKGHRPGQYLRLMVTIGGVVHERCYSLISEPNASTIAIAVKRQPGGVVSNYVNESLKVGDVVELSSAGGEFCFEGSAPEKLLLVAGGSGVTPVYSLAAAALAERPDADVALLYYARTPTDFILAQEFEALAKKHPRLRISFYVDGVDNGSGYEVRSARTGRFCAAHVAEVASDVAEREIYVCGPPGLMNAVAKYCDANGHAERLHSENFGPSFAPRAAGESAEVTFRRANVVSVSTAPTLLLAAEEAGLKPAYGCRMGICHTCTCTKVSGVVRDRVTGKIDDAPGSRIRICVSEPVSAVCIDL